MSLNNNKNQKYSAYSNNQNRGPIEYGQTGYPQQYGYPQTLPSVQNNASHDMSKPVAAQQGMYPNAGGMPGVTQQHHQSMGGPAPNPQPATMVPQSQQIRGNPMPMQGYYTRNSLPRSIPSISRNPLTVVNQTGQQPVSQYGQLQIMSTQFVPQPTMIMNAQFTPQMVNYQQQRTYSPPQNIIIPTQNAAHFVVQNTPQWQGYNASTLSSNNYFQSAHAMSSYNTMPPAAAPQPIPPQPAQSRRKKALDIIDPITGKNILLGMNDDESIRPTPEKETDNADPNICAAFAAQVAATLTEPLSHERLSKSPSIEDTKVLDWMDKNNKSVSCTNEIDSVANIEVDGSDIGDNISLGDLADVESSSDIENVDCYKNIEEHSINVNENSEINNINETYGSEKCILPIVESIPTVETKDSNVNSLIDKKPDTSELPQTVILPNQDLTLESDSNMYFENVENSNDFVQTNEQIIHKPINEVHAIVPQPNIEENKMQKDVSDVALSSSNSLKFVTESKKNKAKKKKDINKKGESKEGGEMDAFLDKGEENIPASTVPVTLPIKDFTSLPVTIVDSEILSTIPLPGETLPDTITSNNVTPSEETLPDSFPQNDASPVEQPSEASSVSPAESDDKENVDESVQNKMVLKYSYKEDQWSPLNPEGKKQYDRDFLLQLQSQPMSLTKPSNLPNLDVIKDKAHIQKLNEVNRNIQMQPPPIYGDHFLPTYAQRGVPRMPQMNYNNRRSLQGREQKAKKIISLSHNVKLHEADNAWKPAYKQDTGADEREKLRRSVQAILNKLTPQKFETLLLQLKNLNIDTVEKLNIVIDLIFEKAVDEPNFSVPYANMCKHLAMVKVPTENNKHINFRKLLLTKCQKEFEKDRSDEIKHEEKQKEVEEAAPEKKKELQQEMYEEEKKMRYRQLGNIRFIGELFKLGMLIEPIMHECIKKLLSQGDEESLECLCKLLKTIGKELDEGKTKGSKEIIELYFQQMENIVKQRLTSARVRFMLQDVIDLKRNNWVPRRDENNPKTIDQIHKEAEREAREMQQILQNTPFSNKRVSDDRDRRKSTARNVPISEDGWTSSTKSNKGSYNAIDPNKLKLTKPDEVDSIRLGPGKAIHNWGRGSSGGTKAAGAESEKTTLTNRYSALAGDMPLPAAFMDNRRGSQRSAASSRESSRGRNTQIPPAIRKTPSTSKERDNAIEAVKGLVRGGTVSETKVIEIKKTAEPHLNGKATDAAELRLKGPILTDEQMEKKTKPLIDEFLHNNDFEEAINCITELASPSTVHIFINAAINQVLERSSQARHSLGLLLCSLVKQNIITFDHYKKGFSCVLEFVDEFALDIPLIWDYLGEILEPMLEDNKYPLTILKDVLQPCIPSETAGMLVSATLHCAAKKRGTIKLGELWRESNLQWTEFLDPNADVNDFIQKHKLEFTVSSAKPKPTTPMSTEEIRKNLLSLLEKTEESEEIFDWIDANVSENTNPGFIRALVSAVHRNAIKETNTGYELDGTKLKKRISILTRYIGHDENLELQALYAIQALMNDLNQPKGVLRQIFDILYDDDVITEESFKNWEKSDDVAEGEGKAIALYSVKSFFTWLKESDSADSVTEE